LTLVIMATLACDLSSLMGPTPTAEIREVTVVVTPEPSDPPIDLAGQWYNSVTTTMTTIVWTGYEFRAASMYDTEDREIRPITMSEWDGTRLKWSYYLASNGLTVTYTMTSLVGDELNCDWINSNDSTGTRTLERSE
jgi:hypothetical protein